MPNRSKDKGSRTERAIVELLKSYGLDAYRIPLSGAAIGFKSDVELRLGNERLRLESKCRSSNFKLIYKWLADNDALVIKADRETPLIVLSLERLAKLLSTIPHTDLENATDKSSPDPLPNSIPQEPQPVTISTNADSTVDTVTQVLINKPRLRPLVVAPADEVSRETADRLELERRRMLTSHMLPK